jgi:hypothetical protein
VQWADHGAAAKQAVGERPIFGAGNALSCENLAVVGAEHCDFLFSDNEVPALAWRDLVDGSD